MPRETDCIFSPVNPPLTRRRSLQIQKQPLNVPPIPPSLLESPYLNSPDSIFRRPISPFRQPTEEDERWLQDTIPITQNSERQRSRSCESNQSTSSTTSSCGRQDLDHVGAGADNAARQTRAPSSPPLMARRRQASSTSPQGFQTHRTPATSNVVDSYFPDFSKP